MASSTRSQSWYMQGDCRYEMPMVLSFDKWTFHGLGQDGLGMFAIIRGQYQADKNIAFVKQYKSYGVTYTGTVVSWKNPFQAQGKWTLPGDSGSWGIVLQGSPTFGVVKQKEGRDPQSGSATEGWFHSILQWSPVPFVATAWDLGSSLFYLATGNHEKAKERLADAGQDVAWDLLTVATAGEGAAEREIANGARAIERAAGQASREAAEAAAHDVAQGFSRRGSMEFHSVLDTEEEARAAASFRSEATHGVGDGSVNQAGSYREMLSRHSLRGITEANHIPAHSSVQGTIYDIGRGNLLALSTEHGLHQGLNRLFGTTGASELAGSIRGSIRNHLLNRDMLSALKLQILTDYGYWGAISSYRQGLRNLINQAEHTICRDGVTPFLSASQRQQLLAWLDEHIARYNRDRGQYIEWVEREILQLAL